MDCYRKIFRIGKVKKNYIYVCVFSHRRNAFGKSTKKQWEMSGNSTPSGGEIKTGVERAREIERDSAHPNFGGKTPTFYWDNLGFSERCHSRVRWLR